MRKRLEIFNKRKALITYITAGDPSLAATEKLIFQLEASGADIIELGIPFSDPLADGPVIQASHQRALKKDVSLGDVFKLVKKVRQKTQIPICFMLSFNLVLKYGLERFYDKMKEVGVNGVIIPDLPPEETSHSNIFLVAPTSTEHRIKMIAEKSAGFIYLVSVAGITGQREQLAGNLRSVIGKIRKYTDLPIAIGFGISSPKQAAEMAGLADGLIVGSAIVDLIAKKKFKQVEKFVSSLRAAIDADS